MNYLIISYYYPPRNGPGGERIAHLADSLANWGHQVDVVTRNWSGERSWENVQNVNVISIEINESNSSQKKINSVKSFLKKQLQRFVDGRVLRTIPFYYFQQTDGKWLQQAVSLMNVKSYDVIIASFPERNAIDLALKIRKIDTKIIIDYRDLYSQSYYSDLPIFLNKFLIFYEKKLIKNVDRFIFASHGLCAKQTHLIPPTAKSSILYNGHIHSENSIKLIKSSKSIKKVGFFGSIYNAKMDIFSVIEKAKVTKNFLFYFYLLNEEDLLLMKTLTVDIKNIFINSAVGHSESLRLQKEMDFLLLLFRADGKDADVPTSKVFEYISTGIPIATNARKHYEVIQILDKINYPWISIHELDGKAVVNKPEYVDISEFHRDHQVSINRKFLEFNT